MTKKIKKIPKIPGLNIGSNDPNNFLFLSIFSVIILPSYHSMIGMSTSIVRFFDLAV